MGDVALYRQKAEEYLALERHPDFIADITRVLEADDHAELEDRFYRDLEFGTGGLRGVIGGGFNRMNPVTVKRATLGLVRYIKKSLEDTSGSCSVVIAYDSRRYSGEFAQIAALVCAANGVKGYVFESLRPTPVLSFAVRRLNASAGIVITASHNPPEYNGYKVYWNDGSQVVPPNDTGIIDEVRRVTGLVETMPRESAIESGLFEVIGERIDTAFLDMIEGYLHPRRLSGGVPKDFSVVYTPLHGTGTRPMEGILERMGVSYTTVPEQREPDGEFPTVESPNPEEGAALAMAVQLATQKGADLVLGTDPDADRLGVAARNAGGSFELLSGNQLGSLLADYILSAHTEARTLPDKPVLIKTIVTTDLQRRIAEGYGARVYDVLTGFKYIGEKIREFEQTGEQYIFGGEESYGYLAETEVRDKDSIGAAALTVEMAAFCRARGRTLLEYLDDIYMRFGYYDEILVSKKFPGSDGMKRMQALMDGLRGTIPERFAGESVERFLDYASGRILGPGNVPMGDTGLPKSDVIQIRLENTLFTVRPSGTEPKIKFYASCWVHPPFELSEAKAVVSGRLESVRGEIERIVEG